MKPHRNKLPLKIFVSILGMLVLSLLSGFLGFIGISQTSNLFERMMQENVTSMYAASDLKIAMLEQRGLTGNFILDNGNMIWLLELDAKREIFEHILSQLQASGYTVHEKNILSRLEVAYREYNQIRNFVIDKYQSGEIEQATLAFVEQMPPLFDETYEACEDLIVANMGYIDDAHRRINSASRVWWYAALIGLLINCGFATLIIFLLLNGVYRPLQQLASEAQRFQSANHEQANVGKPADDLTIVRDSIKSLSNEVASAHQSLIQSQDELLQAERMATVGKLTAGIAHEIRSLLTTMNLWSYALRCAPINGAEVQTTFNTMHIELGRLEQLVQFFLEAARPPNLNQSKCHLPDVIEQAVSLVQPRMIDKGLLLHHHFDDPLPLIMADVEQLKQVFVNLLINACDASEPQGKLSVCSHWKPTDQHGSSVVVRVTNTGEPIPLESHSRIFEQFLTTKKNGTGLGLSIAAAIVQRHGGELKLESSDENGTVFAVVLPPFMEPKHGNNITG